MCGKIAQNIRILLISRGKGHCLLYKDAMVSKGMILIIKVMVYMLHCHYISNDIHMYIRVEWKNPKVEKVKMDKQIFDHVTARMSGQFFEI